LKTIRQNPAEDLNMFECHVTNLFDFNVPQTLTLSIVAVLAVHAAFACSQIQAPEKHNQIRVSPSASKPNDGRCLLLNFAFHNARSIDSAPPHAKKN
jgi:hypothetical protein